MSSKAMVVQAAQAGVVAAIDATTAARLTLDEALKLPDDTPPPAPTISNATVTPMTLPFGGGSVTIDADVTDATEITLDGTATFLPTTRAVTVDQQFVLAATGPGGSAPPVTLSVDVADAPAPTQPVISIKTVVTDRVLLAPGFYSGDRYDRFQIPLIVSGAEWKPTCFTRNINTGGNQIPFGFALPLTLTLDGVAVATTTTVATASSVAFTVPLTGRKGWYRTSVTGLPATWSVYDYAVFVDDGSGEAPGTMPVIIGSYGLVHPYKASSSENPTPIHVSVRSRRSNATSVITTPRVPFRS